MIDARQLRLPESIRNTVTEELHVVDNAPWPIPVLH